MLLLTTTELTWIKEALNHLAYDNKAITQDPTVTPFEQSIASIGCHNYSDLADKIQEAINDGGRRIAIQR